MYPALLNHFASIDFVTSQLVLLMWLAEAGGVASICLDFLPLTCQPGILDLSFKSKLRAPHSQTLLLGPPQHLEPVSPHFLSGLAPADFPV